jgi:uncharacterized protein (DUF2147 family)
MMWRAAVCAMSMASCITVAQYRSPDGAWMRDDRNARVPIAPCGSELCATSIWIEDTSKGEEVGDRLIISLDTSAKLFVVCLRLDTDARIGSAIDQSHGDLR